MVKKITIALLIAVGAAVFYFWYSSDTDEAVIRKNFRNFSKWSSKPSGEKASSMLWKSQCLSGLFDDPCTLEAKHPFFAGEYSPDEIASKAVAGKRNFKSVTLDFYDLNLKLGSEKAEALFTVRLNGILSSGEKVDQVREMNASIIKKDGKWLFSGFKVIQVLRK